MTDDRRQQMVTALMGSMHMGTGDKILDRIAREIEEVIVADLDEIEPIIDQMIHGERAERLQMLLEICEARKEQR